ncbi:MAG: dipeptide ABC transporter ATP-binding protein [Lentisphaeria bacterium]|nr:dipeptide ABC transporter ATP-binding protein [Lentisphaeria bacterium]
MALLEVNNLKVYYPVGGGLFGSKQLLRAVDDVSFKLEHGETLGLVGESGCGKSSLGKALVGLEQPSDGNFTINGVDITQLHGAELRKARKKFQMIFQDPHGSLNPRMRIFNTIDEVLQIHTTLNKSQRISRVAELLKMVDLPPESMYNYPHQFSGGQRQRIGIARALAVEPDFIVADEPVSALDVSVQAAIINLLQDIQQRTGTAFLFIAHDLAVVEHISRRIMVMYLGRVVESGAASEICASPHHPYTMALLSSIPALEQRQTKREVILSGDVPSPLNPPSGCHFHLRCPFAREICRREIPPLREIKSDNPEHIPHCSRCFFDV